MYKAPNYMRMYRKKSALSQKDVEYLLGYIHNTSLCRVEKGQRPPRIDVLLAYHLLFNTSVESIFELRCKIIQPTLIKNCKKLVAIIKKDTYNPRLNSFKVRFLKKVIERLLNS